MTITRKKRRKKSIMQGWVLWFVLTFSFSLMGISMAAFQSNILFVGSVGTAECFVELESDPLLYSLELADRGQQNKTKGEHAVEPKSKILTHDIVINAIDTAGNDNVLVNIITPQLRAVISDYENKNIEMTIVNAYPGDVYRLSYGIANKGTIPVIVTAIISNENQGLSISDSNIIKLEPGASEYEELTIKVNKSVTEQESYSFKVQLLYEQWNILN